MISFLKSHNIHPAWPGLAGALLLLFAALWLLPDPAAAPGYFPGGLPAAPPYLSDTAVGQWGSTALARPLFTPGRHAADQPGASADSALPRLSAIILVDGTGTAVFSANGQKPHLVNQGGNIDGYELSRITPDHIELSGPDGVHSLHPRFSTAAASAATPLGGTPLPPQFAPMPGQTQTSLPPSSNPALMIEQNF